MTSKLATQVWRFIRLFAFGFGGSLLASATATGIQGRITSKLVLSAVIGAGVPAFEVAYRQVWPAGQESKILAFFSALSQAYGQLSPSKPTPVQKALAATADVAADPVPGGGLSPTPVVIPAGAMPVFVPAPEFVPAAQPAIVAEAVAPVVASPPA